MIMLVRAPESQNMSYVSLTQSKVLVVNLSRVCCECWKSQIHCLTTPAVVASKLAQIWHLKLSVLVDQAVLPEVPFLGTFLLPTDEPRLHFTNKAGVCFNYCFMWFMCNNQTCAALKLLQLCFKACSQLCFRDIHPPVLRRLELHLGCDWIQELRQRKTGRPLKFLLFPGNNVNPCTCTW